MLSSDDEIHIKTSKYYTNKCNLQSNFLIFGLKHFHDLDLSEKLTISAIW